MKLFISLVLILFVSGCSLIKKSTHLAIKPNTDMYAVAVYDHVTIDKASWGWGTYAPNAFALDLNQQQYIAYPINTKQGWGSIGFTFILPVGYFQNDVEHSKDKDQLIVEFRHFNETKSEDIIPTHIIFSSDKNSKKIPLKVAESDKVGVIYKADITNIISPTKKLSLIVQLSDDSRFIVKYEYEKNFLYHFANAFNGPAPKPKIEKL
ncbi:hypothetical protein AADZ86_10410 [Colwelliaceae bacterium BS250]